MLAFKRSGKYSLNYFLCVDMYLKLKLAPRRIVLAKERSSPMFSKTLMALSRANLIGLSLIKLLLAIALLISAFTDNYDSDFYIAVSGEDCCLDGVSESKELSICDSINFSDLFLLYSVLPLSFCCRFRRSPSNSSSCASQL